MPTQTVEIAKRIREEFGVIRVLDLRQANAIRGNLKEWTQDGVYYFLPPDGVTGQELFRLLDEYRKQDALHLAFNAQSSLDIEHKPILALDSFAERYFGSPERGVVKLTAIARAKVAELNAIIEEFKRPFSPQEFPGMEEFMLSVFKEPAEGRQTVVTLRLMVDDWKRLTALEDEIKIHMADANMIREILVSRHGVQGLHPEIILSSTEETSEKGNAYLADLANYLISQRRVSETLVSRDQTIVLDAPDLSNLTFTEIGKGKEAETELAPDVLFRTAMETFAETLKGMKEFQGLEVSVAGITLLVQFKRRMFGGHFGKEQAKTLEKVYRSVKSIFRLESGWSAQYSYDKGSRVLKIKATSDGASEQSGWKKL